MNEQQEKDAALDKAIGLAKFAGAEFGIKIAELDRQAALKMHEAMKYAAMSNHAAMLVFRKLKTANVLTGELATDLEEANKLLELGGQIVLGEMKAYDALMTEKEAMLDTARKQYAEAAKSDEVTDVAQAAEYLANITKQ